MKIKRIVELTLPTFVAVLLVAPTIYVVNQNTYEKNQNRARAARAASQKKSLVALTNAVTELEHNNQVNHDTTIKYLNCVLVGVTTSSVASPNQALAIYQSCLSVSGVKN